MDKKKIDYFTVLQGPDLLMVCISKKNIFKPFLKSFSRYLLKGHRVTLVTENVGYRYFAKSLAIYVLVEVFLRDRLWEGTIQLNHAIMIC